MYHREVAELYLGAARYRTHLQKVCKDANGNWRAGSADILRRELHAWRVAFEKPNAEELLYYQHVAEAAWEYSRANGDAEFAQDVLSHMYAMAYVGINRVREIGKNNELISPEHFRALEAIANQLAELSAEIKRGVR